MVPRDDNRPRTAGRPVLPDRHRHHGERADGVGVHGSIAGVLVRLRCGHDHDLPDRNRLHRRVRRDPVLHDPGVLSHDEEQRREDPRQDGGRGKAVPPGIRTLQVLRCHGPARRGRLQEVRRLHRRAGRDEEAQERLRRLLRVWRGGAGRCGRVPQVRREVRREGGGRGQGGVLQRHHFRDHHDQARAALRHRLLQPHPAPRRRPYPYPRRPL